LTKPPPLEKEEPQETDENSSDSDDSNDSDGDGADGSCRLTKRLRRLFPRQLDGVKFELPRRSKLREPHNYTLRSRRGLNVVMEESGGEHGVLFDRKTWDSFEGFDSSSTDWQMGRGDMTRHIISTFHPESSDEFSRKQFFGSRKRRRSSTDLERCETDISMEIRADSDKMAECDGATDGGSQVIVDALKRECPTGEDIDGESVSSSKKRWCSGETLGMNASLVTEDLNVLVLERLQQGWEEDSVDPEVLQLDPSPMCVMSEFREDLANHCLCVSNILRSLSFVPGNDVELAKHCGMLLLLGRLMVLHHTHPKRQTASKASRKQLQEDDTTAADNDDYSLGGREEAETQFREWWSDILETIREDILVILANVSGRINFKDAAP
jgi:AT-rich interactive domain-containing protein 1